MIKTISWFCCLCICFSAVAQSSFRPEEWVNPLMGTDSKYSFSNGNTYPAITLPWGMNCWTPQTGTNGYGWQYTYTADKIRGFKQTHQPSPWMGDYGQFSIMPITGKLQVNEEKRASWFSHKAETANPYYYSVYLADHDVLAEITPTERAAILQFTFPASDSSFVVIDAFDRGSYIKIIPEENKIIGYTTRNRGGVPANFKNYFVIQFNKPFTLTCTVDDSVMHVSQNEIKTLHAQAVVGFKTTKGEQVRLRVASSFISFEQADLNLQREIGKRSFTEIRDQAKAAWNKELGKIKVEGGTPEQIRTFYSCLYRILQFPRKFYEFDINQKMIHYSPYGEGKIAEGYLFTDTGFWDTFRSLFPFLTLLYPEMESQMIQGLANTYKESGWLPEWASPGHRATMVGSNSASVVVDAFMKGIKNFDTTVLYEALMKNTENMGPIRTLGREGVKEYNEIGYVPADKYGGSAAKTLEYAYADFCLYRISLALHKPKEVIDQFVSRLQNYKNLFDPKHKLMRGRNLDGSFDPRFNPLRWGGEFVEGNAWHYSWSVFQDFTGLSKLMGGDKQMERMLDSVYHQPPVFDGSAYRGGVIHEMTEMQVMNMGQYAHGNQPIQHMIYIYNYCGAPWKAQYHVRDAMNRLYRATPDGYCGDEDNGQTSAWYVFSALGFYSVTPGTNQYVIGSPLFKKATLQLENGKYFVIEAPLNSSKNVYIQSADLRGKPFERNYIEHASILKGGTLRFNMGSKPALDRGVSKAAKPYSFSDQ
ncbi:MAG: glycoside hydrolase family 92 protein [Bacteroidetes bacterium]|nr:glycoside hydrolase family 92 protein [Bacteroidota bacterium]